jgi:hypothetical protein
VDDVNQDWLDARLQGKMIIMAHNQSNIRAVNSGRFGLVFLRLR